MATRTFRTPTVTPLTWWRVDTASGSDSRAVIRTPDGSTLIHGLLRADEHGLLSAQSFRGPDSVTTLYLKQIRKAGPGRADTVIAGTTITLDTGVANPAPPASGVDQIAVGLAALVPDDVHYNGDGTVSWVVEGTVRTDYTYNGDGTVHTESRLGKTKTYAYDGNGNVTGSVVA